MKNRAVHEPIEQWARLPDRAEVALLCAPFTYPPIPSIALSIFKRTLHEAGIASKVIYPIFPFTQRMGVDALRRLTALPGLQGLCEFVFASLTDAPNDASARDYVAACCADRPEAEQAEIIRLIERGRACAEAIVEAAARRIVGMGARVLAASSIYAQQNASLAILRRVKALDPAVVTLMGGNNLSGEMGLAVLRRYGSVDYVSFGEGDETIAEFCRMALDGASGPLPYGILSRADALAGFAGPIPHRLTRDMDRVCTPDYGDYFEEIERVRDGFYGPASDISSHYGQAVFLEGSRGCWWGEKHACTFCGLNGLVNKYRQKRPETLLREIREAIAARPDCMIQLSDNMLGGDMYKALLPALAADGRKYRLSAEVRTNLSEGDVAALARAGFATVQPGIESLNDHLLRLMGKGNTAVHHVALLKYCRAHYVHPFWHMLYGVPGEAEADYRALIALIPLIVHLPPPTTATPILFQRFSRYWTDPAAYGLELTPDKSYRLCYGDDDAFIRQVAMYYDLTGGPFKAEKERHQALYGELTDAVQEWKAAHDGGASPDLIMTETRDGLSILDTRPCGARLLTRLSGLAAEVYRRCADPTSPRALNAALGGVPEEEIAACAQDLIDRKLLLFLSGKYLALAVSSRT